MPLPSTLRFYRSARSAALARQSNETRNVRYAQRMAEDPQYRARRNEIARANWARRFAADPESHRRRVRAWRQTNRERASELSRAAQAARRSTPWGVINNRMWPVVHKGVRSATGRAGKYAVSLGYTWRDLRQHLEAQFTKTMTWENWGDVWEIDHVKPLSGFRYESIVDPMFREAWGLDNLRPLLREQNRRKGNRAS